MFVQVPHLKTTVSLNCLQVPIRVMKIRAKMENDADPLRMGSLAFLQMVGIPPLFVFHLSLTEDWTGAYQSPGVLGVMCSTAS